MFGESDMLFFLDDKEAMGQGADGSRYIAEGWYVTTTTRKEETLIYNQEQSCGWLRNQLISQHKTRKGPQANACFSGLCGS